MNPANATVLVVDDELELLEIFATWLRRSGYRVITAPNGAEALKLLAVEKVDTLISDIRMPVMDGTTLVRHIYDMGLTIPSIIFVSGFGPADPREMHALGVEAMLEKPLSRKVLLSALEQGLKTPAELWLAPASEPMQQSLSIDLADLDEATRRQQFQLGHGGCCFPCDQPLVADETIDLTILLAETGACLKGQGDVRWYSETSALAGVAFHYLDPACRDWVVGLIESRLPRSFIPRGSEAVEGAIAPASQSKSDFALVEVT